MPIFIFPDKKKKSNTRKRELIQQSIENAGRLIREYDPKKDPALKASRRKLRDIWRLENTKLTEKMKLSKLEQLTRRL